jgi:outer membrane protein TolC
MAQANAVIGVQRAAYYPTIGLTASGGPQSSTLAKLFSIPALFWSLGASASETIFDAGLRKASVAQYTANYNADVAAYKQTVLTAFQQVEDYIATLRVVSQQITRQDAAVQAAQRYLDIATARMTASVQLIQALGGGWDSTQLPTASQVTAGEAQRPAPKTP